MADWASMTDKELDAFCKDAAKVEAESDPEREKLQVEWCKRNHAKFESLEGTVIYVPPDWVGG